MVAVRRRLHSYLAVANPNLKVKVLNIVRLAPQFRDEKKAPGHDNWPGAFFLPLSASCRTQELAMEWVTASVNG